MSRPYGKISTRLWSSKKFRNLSVEAKLFYMYLHTCPHINSTGCFLIRKGYMQADLDWDDRAIDRAIKELCVDLILYNPDEDIVKINQFLEHSPITNQKHAFGVVKIIMDLPDCQEKYLTYKELASDKYCENIFDHSSMDSPIDSSMDTYETEQETEIETETEQEQDHEKELELEQRKKLNGRAKTTPPLDLRKSAGRITNSRVMKL